MSDGENKARVTISIDPDLLRRIDAVCEAKGQSRSYFIERQLESATREQEDFVQSVEKPLGRAFGRVLLSSPKAVQWLMNALGEEMSDEDRETFEKSLPEQLQRGRERQEAKKKGSRSTDGEAVTA